MDYQPVWTCNVNIDCTCCTGLIVSQAHEIWIKVYYLLYNIDVSHEITASTKLKNDNILTFSYAMSRSYHIMIYIYIERDIDLCIRGF